MKMSSLPVSVAPSTAANVAGGTLASTAACGAGHKGPAPLMRPESVLLNYNLLVAEAKQQQEVLQLRHLEEQHMRRRQAAVLAGLSHLQGSSSTTQVTSRDIIGMGIYVPKNGTEAQSQALSPPPSLLVQPLIAPSVSKVNSKFLQIGRPLSAPPALATKIITREASKRPLQESSRKPAAPVLSKHKKRKLSDVSAITSVGDQPQHTIHTMTLPSMLDSARQVSLPQSPVQKPHVYSSALAKTSSLLSADELEFVMAANALNSTSGSKSRMLPQTKLQPLRMSHLALRPPPSLHL